jgi:integrase
LDEVRSDLLRGTYVAPGAGRVLFADFARTWLEAQPHRAGTARLYERTLRLHVFPRIGDRPLAAVRRSDIQALVTASSRQLAPKTVENHFRLIKAVFNAAVEDQLIAVSPCRKIARATVAPSRVVPLSIEQVSRLVEAAPAHFQALVVTAVGTGLRQGEALGLRAQDVDFLRREVHVRHQLVSVPGVAAHLGPPKTVSSLRTCSCTELRPAGIGRTHEAVPSRSVRHDLHEHARPVRQPAEPAPLARGGAAHRGATGGNDLPPATPHLRLPAHRGR